MNSDNIYLNEKKEEERSRFRMRPLINDNALILQKIPWRGAVPSISCTPIITISVCSRDLPIKGNFEISRGGSSSSREIFLSELSSAKNGGRPGGGGDNVGEIARAQ